MRRRTGMLLAAGLALGACGGSGAGVTKATPAAPVNLTVYINDSRVSLSPDSVGAGQVVFIITNQASKAQSLTLEPAGQPAAAALASTGQISPRGTAQLKVDFGSQDLPPGDYSLTTAPGSGIEAALTPPAIQPATLHIGPDRPSGSNDLLQP